MICEWCKKEFKQKRSNQRFCRRLCAKYSSRKRTGRRKKENKRRGWRKLNINITLEKYNELFQRQEGKCKICQKFYTEIVGKVLHVDHDHNNGNIRGLLCGSCNRGLGFFKDNPQFLQKAIDYLQS